MNLLKPIASSMLEAMAKSLRAPSVKAMLFCTTLSSSCSGIPVDHEPLLQSLTPPDTLVDRVVGPTPNSPVNHTVIADSLEAWVAYALAHNPEVTAAFAQYQSAQAQVPQVTALPDPKISYRFFFEQIETRVGPQKFAVGLSQPLPWLSKLRLQGAAASQSANAAAVRISTVQNRIISEVAHAWYELYYFDRGVEIMRGNRDLVVHLERLARTRYGSGAAGHPDVIRAQIELARIEKELASFTDRASPLLARLNAVLNRPGNAPISRPVDATLQKVAESDEEILQRVVSNNPELKAIMFELAAAGSKKERAGKAFLPDFSIGIDYIATGNARSANVVGRGDDPISAGITMTLPIQRGRYRAGVQAAEAGIVYEMARRDRQLNKLQSQTASMLFRLNDAERQVALYQSTLLPKAHESLMATQRAYSTGDVSFADLIDAQRVLLVFELAEVRAITDHNQARISLEALMGTALSTGLSPEEYEHE